MALKTPDEMEKRNLKTRVYLITAVILLAGLGSAVLIYLTARNDADGALGYEVADGNVYPIRPEDSRMYVHDLELYGGKTILLADEFRRWFVGLWQGRSLAFTVAGITILVSGGFFFFAGHQSSDPEPDAGDKKDRARTGSFS